MKLSDLRAELERELGTRKGVYPTWIEKGSIKKEVAAHRIEALERTIAILMWLEKSDPERVKASVLIMSLAESKAHASAMTLGLPELKMIFTKYPHVESELKDLAVGKQEEPAE
jgi:hypothetical protein